MISIKNNSLKSLSAGITTRAGGGKVAQYPARKAGQPTSGTKVKPAAPTLKAVETAKPPKAPTRPKPFVVSKALAASKVLNVSPAPGTLKPVAACKPLNIVKRSSAPKASGFLKTRAASKVLDITGAADTPKLPPGLKAPGSPKTYAAAVAACKPLNIVKRSSAPKAIKAPALTASKVPDSAAAAGTPKISPSLKASDAPKIPSSRISAVEAVRRQISEQKQKAAAVTARKAKGKSEPLPAAKPKAVTSPRTATSPSAPAMRPKAEVIKAEVIKAEVITASANAAENVPFPRSPARRPLPAVRKGGVRKPLAVISRPSSTSSTPSPPSSPPHTGGGCNRHQRNSLSAAERLSERALTRRNAIRVRDPMKLRSSVHAAAVTRSSSAPLLGWAKAVVSVTRSQSGPIILGKVVKPVLPPTSLEAESSIQNMNPDTPSGEDAAADTSPTVKVGAADTSTISTLVGSDEDASVGAAAKAREADTSTNSTFVGSNESTSVHEPFAALPRFQIEIQDFDVQSDTFPAPRARDSMSSLSSLSFSSILDMFPPVPVGIPGPLTQDVHRQLMEMSPAFAADKAAADGGWADESMSNASSTSSISSILDQFPIVPTFIPRPLPQRAHRQLAAMIPATATDKVAADDVLPDGNMSNASSASSISSILDQFPIVPTFIPRPLPRTAHLQLASTSPTFAVDKPAAGDGLADDSVSTTSSTSSISSILDQFPVVPTYIPRPLPQRAHQQLASLNPIFTADTPAASISPADKPAADPAPADKPASSADPAPADDDCVRISIISLDGDAPVLDTPAAWKAAFDTESTAVGSSVSSHKEKAPVVSKAVKGVKGWWKRVVGKK